MKQEISEAVKKFNSNRRALHFGGHTVFCVKLTSEERKTLYCAARESGLLMRYEFSGIPSYGVSRSHAAALLLEVTHQKALGLLRREFGSCARFWVRPKQLSILGTDFYWKKAKLGLAITGPLMDDPYRGDPKRTRDSRPELEQQLDSLIPESMKGLAIIKVPYYLVWHQPSDFIRRINSKLIASGQYTRLRDKI